LSRIGEAYKEKTTDGGNGRRSRNKVDRQARNVLADIGSKRWERDDVIAGVSSGTGLT